MEKNDEHLNAEQKMENDQKEEMYPRNRYEVIISGEGLVDFKDIYSRINELKLCHDIEDSLLIQPAYDEDQMKHRVNITDKPPNLPVLINNVDKNIKIDPNNSYLIDLATRYGLVDIERIFLQDNTPTNKLRANVLTLYNYIDLLKNGIYLDLTSMKHTVKASITYAKVCQKCGSINHNTKDCKFDRCLRCGNYDHSFKNCKNIPKCVNCDGSHQSNSEICNLLTNKNLTNNRYTLDILVKESIINSTDDIF
ncbi:unnamed protein product [Brachionus calyciflorus]|uniref:CCHC-type domain-containing protein n=1 Tax=Brachionus calyciflorus TaxID=104777 RepID=A0A814I3I4_9BILA|nr:unnamed protein product [Brachionus calyciflorus]